MSVSFTYPCFNQQPKLPNWKYFLPAVIAFLLVIMLIILGGRAFAQQVPCPAKIADAIYRAENSKSHPYGVMIKCKNPRQVCINTINHALADWNGKGDFIVFLGIRYCPNDNKNWARMVKYFMEKI